MSVHDVNILALINSRRFCHPLVELLRRHLWQFRESFFDIIAHRSRENLELRSINYEAVSGEFAQKSFKIVASFLNEY